MVDIGCNDGTLLDGYATDGGAFLGFDPSDVTRYAVEKGYEVVRDFFAGRARERYPDRRPRSSRASRCSTTSSRRVRRGHRPSLAEDGIWVIELHYLPDARANSFDAIVHEHLEYYSLAVIERLLGDAGLEVSRPAQRYQRRLDPALRRARAGARAAEDRAPAGSAGPRVEMALDSAEPYDAFRSTSSR